MSSLENQQLLARAVALHRGGRFADAEDLYRRILAIEPNNWDALHLLGLVAYSAGKLDLAIELIQHALAIQPSALEVWANLATVYGDANRPKDAEAAGLRALQINPEHPMAQLNYATALALQGRLAAALPYFENLAKIEPSAKVLHNLALAHRGLDHLPEAEYWSRQELQRWPDDENGYLDLSMVLQDQATRESLIEAIDVLNELKRRMPNLASPHSGMSAAYFSLGRYEESRKHADIALQLDSQEPVVRFNHSIQLLWKGDYARGWEEYEGRMRRKDVPFPWRRFSQPKWEGQELSGRTVVVCAEQGFGDSMQYARFLPRLVEKGARIYIACEAELVELMRCVPGVIDVLNQEGPMPPFDYFLPLPSLPHAFGVTLETIPPVAMLHASRELVESWRKRLQEQEQKSASPSGGRDLRIGLCWAGSPRPFRARTMGFTQLAPLGEIKGVAFHSLQKGPAGDAIAVFGDVASRLRIADHRSELTDFAQSAALVANLDLVITIDSAAAHLAASVGAPTWIMLPLAADWRWRLVDGRSPWYLDARLFQQPSFGDWAAVVRQVKEALSEFAAQRRVMLDAAR